MGNAQNLNAGMDTTQMVSADTTTIKDAGTAEKSVDIYTSKLRTLEWKKQ